MFSPSSIITGGLGSWGDVGSIITFGYGLGTAVAETEILAGAGYPVFKKQKFVRKPSIKELLDVAMSEIYEAGTEESVDKETKLAFAKIVKPYADSKAKIPKVESINWVALQKDAEQVDKLLKLWQQQINNDNEIILMAYEEFY